MPRFRYKAKKDDGKVVNKMIEASDYAEAHGLLVSSGLEPIKITQFDKDISKEKNKKMTLKEVTIFCRQFVTMLASGVSLVRAMDILREQALKESNFHLYRIYDRVYQDVQKGYSLNEAMLAQDGVFPPMLIHMVEAGEISGSLDNVLGRTAEYYESQNKLINRVQTSLMYPKLLVGMIIFIVLGLFAFVLPQFFVVFDDLSLELPRITEIIIMISDFVIYKWYILVIVVVALLLAWSIAMTNERFAYRVDYLKTKLPIVKVAVEKVAIANFTSTMGVLYSSGVSMLQALEISAAVLNNRYYTDKFEQVIREVETGKMLSTAVAEAEVFDPMVTSLLRMGEESGNLESVFETTAVFYMNEAEEAIARMITAIEPIVIVVIGLIVLLVVAAVLMPTFSMATQISDQAASGDVAAGQ